MTSGGTEDVESGSEKQGATPDRQTAMPAAKIFPNQQQGKVQLYTILPKWWKIASLWFAGPERWKAVGYSIAVITLALSTTAFLVRISYAQKAFSTALSGKDVDGFYKAVWQFVVIICIAAPFFSFTGFVEDRMVLAWRAYLTRYFKDAYFRNQAYFRVRQHNPCGTVGDAYGDAGSDSSEGIDNPDQRICDDVAAFVRSSTSITLSLCKKVFNCVAFASVLWSVSGELVAFMFIYAIFGTFVTTAMFGRILMNLYYSILACEADLRFSLVRVREAAESIAFYGGERAEAAVVTSRLNQVIKTAAERIRMSALYDLWTSAYNYATILAPSIITAPKYFRGEIEFGTISQASYAFSTIESALSIIINNLGQITGLAAETDRLDALLAAMEARGEGRDGPDGGALAMAMKKGEQRIARQVVPGAQGLVLGKLSVVLPRSQPRRLICASLSLEVSPGQSLLVVGPSGCGKSSLLRALAGLWREGSGSVRMPSSVFFLPQKSFMPLGSLRHQLLFPTGDPAHMDAQPPEDEAGPKGGADAELTPLLGDSQPGAGSQGSSGRSPGSTGGRGPGATSRSGGGAGAGGQQGWATPLNVTDEELVALLQSVNLGELVAKVGGLDAEHDYSHMLSAGEQQRIAFCRLLLHAPELAFLDEATSALDTASEANLYARLQQSCVCYVSVGHRMQLLKYHTHVLQALEDGQWVKTTAAEFRQDLEARTGLTLA